MKNEPSVGILMAAREVPPDSSGRRWEFYLVNVGDIPIDARMERVGYEWGDVSNVRDVTEAIDSLGPRTARAIWRDDDDASEINVWFELVVTTPGETRRLTFSFPKLYLRHSLASIPLVGGQGVVVAAAAST